MKALVLASGGLDSSVCLALAISKYGKDNVIALSITYGQKHIKEIESLEKICKYYDIKKIDLDLTSIFAYSKSSLLKWSDKDIPKGEYEIQLEKNSILSTYVPFRNGLFLSSAASIALSLDSEVIYYGAHMDDARSAYPDCTKDFNDNMNNAIYYGSGNKLTVIAPFINKKKADIVKIGHDLNVPFNLTWSCYMGHDKACGVCGTCMDRKKAFEMNNLIDPIEYEV